MQPRIWHQCSLIEYLILCDMMDSWDENLRKMPHCDWTIHRKLGEEAGLAHRYIIPARGSGKSMFIDTFDDPKKILRKNHSKPEPQEFVTIKDGDIEKWLQEEIRKEQIEIILDIFRENRDEGDRRRVITSHNPYWSLDPCWMIDKDGNYTLKEVSYVPNYLWDRRIL